MYLFFRTAAHDWQLVAKVVAFRRALTESVSNEEQTMEKLIVFASGTKTGGGSGARKLKEASRNGVLDAEIAAFVSNHAEGGVMEHALQLGVPFIHFPAPWTAERYQAIMKQTGAKFAALSGWLKFVRGLDPRTTFNIHPGPLPLTGGLHGMQVHEAALAAYRRGEIAESAVTMHFVTEAMYDDVRGVFCRCPVPIFPDDTAETLAGRVNKFEHEIQPEQTNLVVTGRITWDGENSASVRR